MTFHVSGIALPTGGWISTCVGARCCRVLDPADVAQPQQHNTNTMRVALALSLRKLPTALRQFINWCQSLYKRILSEGQLPDQCRLAAAMSCSWPRRGVSRRPHPFNARANCKRTTPRVQQPAPKEPKGARAVPASRTQIRVHTGQAGQLVQRKERHPSKDFPQGPGCQMVLHQAWRRHRKWSQKKGKQKPLIRRRQGAPP